MPPVSELRAQYDRATVFFHWAAAILVAEQWLGAQIIDWFPRGPLRVDARSVHIALGATLALLMMARLAWRATRGRHLPPADLGIAGLVAKATHGALYALILATILVGTLLAWARGDSLFNLMTIPAFDPTSRALAEQLQEVHEALGWLILALAGLHAAAALAHHYILHDTVLTRMLPRA